MVELVSDFVVCEEGKPISPESARILVSIKYLSSVMNLSTISYGPMCLQYYISYVAKNKYLINLWIGLCLFSLYAV